MQTQIQIQIQIPLLHCPALYNTENHTKAPPSFEQKCEEHTVQGTAKQGNARRREERLLRRLRAWLEDWGEKMLAQSNTNTNKSLVGRLGAVHGENACAIFFSKMPNVHVLIFVERNFEIIWWIPYIEKILAEIFCQYFKNKICLNGSSRSLVAKDNLFTFQSQFSVLCEEGRHKILLLKYFFRAGFVVRTDLKAIKVGAVTRMALCVVEKG